MTLEIHGSKFQKGLYWRVYIWVYIEDFFEDHNIMLRAKCVIESLGENREYQETLLEVFAPEILVA